MFDLAKLQKRTTRLFTAENVYGEKGKGGMAPFTEAPQEEVIKIGQHWAGPNIASRELGHKWKLRPDIHLLSGKETTILDTEGPSRIAHIWSTVDAKYYRDIILRMYWDGEEHPSVEVPIGDFFCCGWNTRLKISSIPINVNPTGGMNCYMPMPFKSHAKITVENRGPEEVVSFFYAITCEDGDVAEDEAYFHAQFRRANPQTFMEDYVIVDGIKGKGHFVGTYMGWQQNNTDWWGEGEIKGFIDGDTEYPTYCGTGSEDYFGGAWGFLENYTAPYMGYIDLMTLEGRKTNQIGNRHIMYRFHIMDPIHFEQDFKLTMQAMGWRSGTRFLPLQDDICSVAYWYQLHPHAPFPPLGDRDFLEVI